jgi:hypothetical protein
LRGGFFLKESHPSVFQQYLQVERSKIMNKDAIKIVKRNEKDETQKEPVVPDALKVEKDDQLKMANEVNNWISERRENSRAEKLFSDGELSGWKTMFENF